MKTLKEQLTQCFTNSLPGSSAHRELAPEGRSIKAPFPQGHHKKGAIIIPLFPHNTQWYSILIKRPPSMLNHAGQLCFPGGKFDPQIDTDFLDTALREAKEEVGIQIQKHQVIGQLSPLYIPVSDFYVHPFVAILDKAPEFQLQTSEVDHLFEINMADFLQEGKVFKKTILIDNKKVNIPYYDVEGERLWGASAMIFNELLHLWKMIGNN